MFQDYCEMIKSHELFMRLSVNARACLVAFTNSGDEYSLVENHFYVLSIEDKKAVVEFLQLNQSGCNYTYKLLCALENYI